MLSVDPPGPTTEESFAGSGTILGAAFNNMATFTGTMRPDGTVFGEGQGLAMTTDGVAITWKGQGVGQFGEGGAVSFRGAIYFQTDSEQFAQLNTVAGVFEYEEDAEDNYTSTVWEWK